MIYQVDVIDEVVLLIDADYQVVDGFNARGLTRHEGPTGVKYYTYRSFLTPPGGCCLCGKELDGINEPCVSSGGFHAFAGVGHLPEVPDQHKVEHRSLPIHAIAYEEFQFFLENDNLFGVNDILKGFEV